MSEPVFNPSLPVLGVQGGEASPLVPLLLHMEGCATQEEMNSNVTKTIERGYVRFNEYLTSCSGKVNLCGAGPSLKTTYKGMTGDVLAVNSAIGFLLDHGVVPKFGMIWDAAEICENFAVPHPEVTYLIGARCHPKVFERLKDCKVIVWHAAGDHNIVDFLAEKSIAEPLINGGSAGVTRGMYLAVALGYRELHVHGADSSYSEEGETHIRGSLVPEKNIVIHVGNHDGHKSFRTTPEWCAQIEEFKMIYPYFRAMGINVFVEGDGMLPHVYRVMANSFAKAEAEAEEKGLHLQKRDFILQDNQCSPQI